MCARLTPAPASRWASCGFAATTAIVLGDWATTERYVGISAETDPGSQFAFWGGQLLMQRAIVSAWRG